MRGNVGKIGKFIFPFPTQEIFDNFSLLVQHSRLKINININIGKHFTACTQRKQNQYQYLTIFTASTERIQNQYQPCCIVASFLELCVYLEASILLYIASTEQIQNQYQYQYWKNFTACTQRIQNQYKHFYNFPAGKK